MSEAEEIRIRETKSNHTSTQIPGFPRDLLRRFISESRACPKSSAKKRESQDPKAEVEEEEDDEVMELSLGLSLNGRFGIDPKAKTKLTRSSSIPDFIINNKMKPSYSSDKISSLSSCPAPEGIVRTCSLPVETEEEWRKRKDLQSLRRLEAKRKRFEKQKNHMRTLRVKPNIAVGVGENGLEDSKREGSIGSSGSGSSGLSELDSNPPLSGTTTNKLPETRSPSSPSSVPVENRQENQQINKETAVPVRTSEAKVAVVRNTLEDMPCVSTKGDGPNGRRIEGFLYRYRKGEEVRIVCVCHGSFLSPAEFVKHAGGADVAHPLKHIVVSPSPSL